MLRLAQPILFGLLLVSTSLGLAFAIMPAFGFIPDLGGNRLTLDHWQELANVPGIVHSVRVSLLAALLTPLLSLTAVFLFLASTTGSWLERWTRHLVSPLLAIPHAAAAFGLAFLIAPSGFLFRQVSPWLTGWERAPDFLIINDAWGITMIVGLVLKEIPFILLMAVTALPQLNPTERLRIARSLGYSPVIAWLKVVAPGLYPLLRLPLFAVIAFSSATVDVAIILGPGLPPTLSVSLLEWFGDPDLQKRFLAGTAAVLQLGVSLLAIATWIVAERLVKRIYQYWIITGDRRRGEWLLKLSGRLLVPISIAIMLACLVVLAIFSLSGLWQFPESLPGTWTLSAWQRAIPGLGTPLLNTLIIAVTTTLIALTLVIGSLEYEYRTRKYTGIPAWVLFVPLITPQVVFLFGLAVLTESLRWQPGILIVILAHLLFVLPYVYLTLSGPFHRIDTRLLQTAASLGISQNWTFWRVRLPLLLGPLLTTAAIGVAISVSLFLPTQMPGAGRVNTITTEAVAQASGGNSGLIAVWTVTQTLLPMLGFSLALLIPKLIWRHRQGMLD